MTDTLLLSFIAFSFLLGQFSRISIGNGIQFYVLDLFVLVHVVILLFKRWKKIKRLLLDCRSELRVYSEHGRREASRKRNYIVMVVFTWFAYVITLLMFTAWGKDFLDNLKAGMYIARIGLFAVYFYLLMHIKTSTHLALKILKTMSIAVPVICLSQYIVIPDLRFLAQFGWDPHMYRAVGLMLDPPIVGVVLGVLFFISVVQKDYVGTFLNFSAAIFLYSRSTYIAVGVVMLMYLLLRKKYISVVVWIVILSLSIYLAPRTIPPYLTLESAKIERVSTVLSRRVELENGFRAWMSHPIFGIGYNRVAEYKQSLPHVYGEKITSNHSSSAFHSFWLTHLATTGIVGFVLLIGAYLLAMRRSINWALALSVPALVGLLDNVVFHPFIITLFIFIYFSKVLDRKDSHSSS